MRLVVFLVVSLLLGAASPARADFIKDFRDWQKLGTEGQAAYAMAVFDVMTVVVDNNPFAVARSVGLRTCGINLKLNAANVAQAITKFYIDYPEARRASPFIAFNGYVERGACSPFVNQARKQMGLPPMAPSPIPKPSQ
jgi:opacity protein-like surface antigen